MSARWRPFKLGRLLRAACSARSNFCSNISSLRPARLDFTYSNGSARPLAIRPRDNWPPEAAPAARSLE